MNQSDKSPTPEELNSLENDAVWTLLDEATPAKASPDFVSNVMGLAERTKQNQSEEPFSSDSKIVTSPSFWKRYAIPLGTISAAGIAACVMLAFNANDHVDSTTGGDSISAAPTNSPAIELTDEELVALAEDEGFPLESLVATSEADQLDQLIAIDDEDPFFMTADDINVLVSM